MTEEPVHSRQLRRPQSEPHATVALAGDVMLGRFVNEVLHTFGQAYPWGNTLPLLQQADLTLANLECVIAADGTPWQRSPKAFHFRADPIALEALRVAGIDAVCLANNHVMDYEVSAFLEMLDRLDAVGVGRAGAGRDLSEAARPVLLTANGIRLALIAFTDNEPGWAATSTSPGINHIPISLDPPNLSRLRHSIDLARVAGADLVLCTAHWGPNMRQRPAEVFRKFARAVLDAGADLFCGHSAHIFQGIELHDGKPILYDMGDFVDDYAVDADLRNDQSLLFFLTVDKHGVREIEALPVRIRRCQVNLAEDGDVEQIAARLFRLSVELGTDVRAVNGRLRVMGKMETGGLASSSR